MSHKSHEKPLLLFLPYQQIPIIIQRQVALLITEKIGFALLGFKQVGEIIKIKTPLLQFAFGHIGFASGVKLLQNAAVAAQYVVNVAHIVIAIAV